MIYRFSKPVVEITEIDRRQGDLLGMYNNTGLIYLSNRCHACGMTNIHSLISHDLLNPFCPWSIFRGKNSYGDVNKHSVVHIICPIHMGAHNPVELCFFMFSCKHILCIPCAMSLVPFRCPYCRTVEVDSSYIVRFNCE